MPENMKRKITVEAPISKSNDTHRRPSVFERLGTKAPAPLTATPVIITSETVSTCRHWVQGGTCPYGKNCKYANTHTLISPSKQRAAKKDSETQPKSLLPPGLKSTGNLKEDLKRLHSAVIKKSHSGTSPELNWENWDQSDLEYEDEKVLEKRRQLLQRELELQMSKEKDEKKKKVKKVKKGASSSSSTSASSSSSTDSSSSSDDSSSTSSSTSVDSRRKKVKAKAGKRDSSSSTSGDRKKKAAAKSTMNSGQPSAIKKPPAPRKEESRSASIKRRDSPAKRPATTSSQSQAPIKKRDSPSRTRHRSASPPSHSHSDSKDVKKPAARNSSPVSKSSLSNDRKDKRSVSPRSSARNRDREREREKEKVKEREKEKERDREKQRDKPRGQDRSHSPPKGKGKDRASSPKRNSRPRDPRKKDSPEAPKDKGGRSSPSKTRRSSSRGRNTSLDNKYPSSSRDSDRRDSSRNDSRDARDKPGPAKKSDRDSRKLDSNDKGGKSKDGNLNKSTGNRGREDTRREDLSSNRDSRKAPPASSKSNHDRDVKDDKDRGKDGRDNRDNRDNADPRLRSTLRLREMRDSEREKEREEALERCKERQRERERKAREEKAREHERELPSLLMIATHNPIKNTRNSTGTEGSKGLDKGSERGSDRSHEKERDRDFDKDRERDRNLSRPSDRDRDRERVSDRVYERGPDHDRDRDRDRDRGLPDRGFERDRPPVKGPHDRGLNRVPRDHSFERTADRSFEREPDRGGFEPRHLERDNHSERDYGRDRPPLDDKGTQGYDSPYDSRRARDDRGRYSDQMERGRYEDTMPSKGDQRRPGSDSRIFPDDRRVGGRREGRNSLEPPWEGRPRNDRVETDTRRRPGYERDEPRSPLPPIKPRDWEGRDYPESRREWEGRSTRRGPPQDWDNQRRGEWSDKEGARDDWDLYPASQPDWPPEERWAEDWERERPPRQSGGLSNRPGPPPPRGPAHRDSEPLDYNQREVKLEEPVAVDEVKEPTAEPAPLIVAKEEDKSAEVTEVPTSLKRQVEAVDYENDKPEAKKICLEEQVPLEEDLSDISDDDADEILNREDIELATNLAIQEQSLVQPLAAESPDVTKMETEHSRDAIIVPDLSRDSNDRQSLLPPDDETIDAMNFEDISDEELEEEAKAGLGDALGVDWASLVAESRPRVTSDATPGSGRRRWDGHRMLARLGVSYNYAGSDVIDRLVAGFKEINREDKEGREELAFLHPVALIHVALKEKRERRRTLFETAGPFKRALSARRDLLVRRQLCNLPVNETTVEAQGVGTEDIYRLAVQLFERERGV